MEMWVDLESVTQTEVSQKEKKILYINAYTWNLEKWYRWSYLLVRNRDADVENECVDIRREEEGGMNWETEIDIYTLRL